MADAVNFDAACSGCNALCSGSAKLDQPRPKPHATLVLEWRTESIAFYFCNQCKASLVHYETDAARPWAFAPVQSGGS